MDHSSVNHRSADFYEVIIIGGGPAGLSAALVLGRCMRKVLICDAGEQRNLASEELKSFLTRDKIAPEDFLQIGRKELKRYANVEFQKQKARTAKPVAKGFRVELYSGKIVESRKLLLATGLLDEIPAIPGFEELYGKSVFLCPYCDGWEQRDKKLAAYGSGERAFDMASGLTAWSKDVTLFTNGPTHLDQRKLGELQANGIAIYKKQITRLTSRHGSLTGVELIGGQKVPADALFFDTPSFQKSELAEHLGCEIDEEGAVRCEEYQSTNVPGLYAAGNLTKQVILAIVAAAEGAKAAFGINLALTRENWKEVAKTTSPSVDGDLPL